MRKNNKNKGLKVGDRIREGSRYGKIVAFHTTGTVDVIFDGENYPMRRQLPNVHKENRKNPKRRKNSSHLPPVSVGKKLEPLLCSRDEETREQFGELILSLFPDVDEFIDWDNSPKYSDIVFYFHEVSKADELEKWAKKAFSKKVDVERYPDFYSVWLRCKRGAIVNSKRRKNGGHLPPTSLGKKLEPMLCSFDMREQFAEFMLSLFPTIIGFNIYPQSQASSFSDILFSFSKASDAEEFANWASKAFTEVVDVDVNLKEMNVYLVCESYKNRYKTNSKRRKNSNHLPSPNFGKQLEPLLCSYDEEMRRQFGELILSLFPNAFDFHDWSARLGNSYVDFYFHEASQADEFKKWVRKAFSKKVKVLDKQVNYLGDINEVTLTCERKKMSDTIAPLYKNNPDIERIQFEAQVQGIYESQVREFLGLPYNTPFENKRGKRIDQKLTKKERREILSGAFAIATAVGRKHGYLHPSPDRSKPYPVAPTKKGVKRILERVADPEELREDQERYEETLLLARKNPAPDVSLGGKLQDLLCTGSYQAAEQFAELMRSLFPQITYHYVSKAHPDQTTVELFIDERSKSKRKRKADEVYEWFRKAFKQTPYQRINLGFSDNPHDPVSPSAVITIHCVATYGYTRHMDDEL